MEIRKIKSADAVILETVIDAFNVKIKTLKNAIEERLEEWEETTKPIEDLNKKIKIWDKYIPKHDIEISYYLKPGHSGIFCSRIYEDGYEFETAPYKLIPKEDLIMIAKRLRIPFQEITKKIRENIETINKIKTN